MRVQVSQETLEAGLRTVGRAVSTRSTVPALAGIYLAARGGELCLLASDTEFEVHTRLPVQVEREGRIILPARTCAELVRRLPPGPVGLQVEPGSTFAHITAAGFEYGLHGLPGDQFPADPDGPDQRGVVIPGAALRTLLREVCFAVGHDERRPLLTGVCFSVRGSRAQAIATNNAIVAVSRASVVNPAALEFTVTIPGRCAQEVGRLLAETPARTPAEMCELLPLHNQLLFRLGCVCVITRLLDGSYPDVLRLLPQAYPGSLRVNRDDLVAACERTLMFADKGTMRLTASASGLHMEAQTHAVGRVAGTVPGALVGEPFTVTLNAAYVLEGLKAMHGPTVLIEVVNRQSAVRFRSPETVQPFFAVLPLLGY